MERHSDKNMYLGVKPSVPATTNLRHVIVAAKDGRTGRDMQLHYTHEKVIGNGSFGVVYRARLMHNGEDAAIKAVLQDKRFKNRELEMMTMMDHPNVCALRAYFYNQGEKRNEIYLNLVMEYVPETVYRVARHYAKIRQPIPVLQVKIYMYQLFRALAYCHSVGICHRDIKPQNLLLEPISGVLKLCDFGSAKILNSGDSNVSYICSRYYRAPELIFGAAEYSIKIDIWSAGCVMAELLLGQPLFPGESGIDQLVEIIKVLGTPSREQIELMNPDYDNHKFPLIKPHPLSKIFRLRTPPEAIDLLSSILQYNPLARPSAIESLAHPFFDELRNPDTKMPTGRDLPPLFNFTAEELSIQPELIRKLVPPQCYKELASRGIDIDQFVPVPNHSFDWDITFFDQFIDRKKRKVVKVFLAIVNCIEDDAWKIAVKTKYDAWKRTTSAKTYWKHREDDDVEAADTESVMIGATSTTTTTITALTPEPTAVEQIRSTEKLTMETHLQHLLSLSNILLVSLNNHSALDTFFVDTSVSSMKRAAHLRFSIDTMLFPKEDKLTVSL